MTLDYLRVCMPVEVEKRVDEKYSTWTLKTYIIFSYLQMQYICFTALLLLRCFFLWQKLCALITQEPIELLT